MPLTPSPTARTASSGCTIPLSTTGSRVRSRSVARCSTTGPGWSRCRGRPRPRRRARGEVVGRPGCSRMIDSSDRTAVGVILAAGRPPVRGAASRSATICWKRGSEVYCAMPMPRENGRLPRLRSCGRHPSIVVSRVTTSASEPMASARRMRLSTSCSSVLQYSWNHRGACPITAATCSIGLQPWLEMTNGTPCPAAAPAASRSLSRCASAAAPMGASSSGVGRSRPRRFTARSLRA